ncbi:hypothetical protein PMAC_001895 [Pneumocystis sp. 'macacae']|nr:hypothetical protein PMAC_001895 [Pneumocystis sp. 'macacae']
MHFPSDTSHKGSSLGRKTRKDVSADPLLKDCMLNSYGATELEKTDVFLGSGALKTPEASQSSEDQESSILVSVLDSQTGLPEVSRQRRRRRRTAPQELAILEEEYLKDERPNLLNRERIASKINSMSTGEDKMSSREIQIWFQNKRQAMRRQTSYSALPSVQSGTVSTLQATKQLCYREIDMRLQQHIEHRISSFKRIPSLRLCTNEGGKAQVMFNILRENKNIYGIYKDNDGKSEGKSASYFVGKENVPPASEKNEKSGAGEDEMEECARSLVGLAQGW